MGTRNGIARGLSLAGLLLGLAATSTASAQCADDSECAAGERCEQPIVPACTVPPCLEDTGGRCVSELLGQPCDVDADCGDGLICTRLLLAECPQADPACEPADEPEGFCSEEGSGAELAATSGLAPGTAEATGTAGGDAPTSDTGDGGAEASGCSVGGSGRALSLGWLTLAALVLLRRRR